MTRDYIVCVDDEQAVLNQLSGQLTRRFGATHRVECAESAEEALALVPELTRAGDEVQLVICDQVMPGMKGDRFLEIVSRQWPETMKILLTGQAGLDSAIYAINHAALNQYVEKPWEAEDLNLAVEGLLTQYDLRRALRRYHDRLGRHGRELRALHEVARQLSSAAEIESALALAAGAAARLAAAPSAAGLADLGAELPLWSTGAADTLDAGSRQRVEAWLTRATTGAAPVQELRPGLLVLPLVHAERVLGALVLQDAPPPDADAQELLSVLAGQASATVHALAQVQERLRGERLSTVGRMISTIVHDFRNPMTAMRGYAAMLDAAELPRARQKEYARLVIEETDRMGAMIDELLEFARGGPVRLRISPVSLEALCERVHRLLEPDLKARGMSFRAELGYKGGMALDAERIQRALVNIAVNALDAMEPGGVFTLGSRLVDGTVELTLDDTGIGIPEAVRARIFEPFFTHGKPRGIGLGMSITRKIVEDHGGAIHVGDGPHGGTRFTILLPLAPRTTPDAPVLR
jgi:signal transduction histidine kinase